MLNQDTHKGFFFYVGSCTEDWLRKGFNVQDNHGFGSADEVNCHVSAANAVAKMCFNKKKI